MKKIKYQYEHKSYGWCSKCGFGSCKHLDKCNILISTDTADKLNKALFSDNRSLKK